jgi:hypothetical protein
MSKALETNGEICRYMADIDAATAMLGDEEALPTHNLYRYHLTMAGIITHIPRTPASVQYQRQTLGVFRYIVRHCTASSSTCVFQPLFDAAAYVADAYLQTNTPTLVRIQPHTDVKLPLTHPDLRNVRAYFEGALRVFSRPIEYHATQGNMLMAFIEDGEVRFTAECDRISDKGCTATYLYLLDLIAKLLFSITVFRAKHTQSEWVEAERFATEVIAALQSDARGGGASSLEASRRFFPRFQSAFDYFASDVHHYIHSIVKILAGRSMHPRPSDADDDLIRACADAENADKAWARVASVWLPDTRVQQQAQQLPLQQD